MAGTFWEQVFITWTFGRHVRSKLLCFPSAPSLYPSPALAAAMAVPLFLPHYERNTSDALSLQMWSLFRNNQTHPQRGQTACRCLRSWWESSYTVLREYYNPQEEFWQSRCSQLLTTRWQLSPIQNVTWKVKDLTDLGMLKPQPVSYSGSASLARIESSAGAGIEIRVEGGPERRRRRAWGRNSILGISQPRISTCVLD